MALRDAWIEKRLAAANGNGAGPDPSGVEGMNAASGNGAGRNMSQMHFARKGIVTEEMDYVARREITLLIFRRA